MMKQTEYQRSVIADYYSLHYDEIYAFVASRMLYADESEDIVQDIFVRLLRMDKMLTPISLPCLVYTIAQNLVFDYWRHRQKEEQYEYVVQVSGRCADDVETLYSVREINEILERGIARLCDKQRKVYCMNIFDGKRVSEIARELNLNYKNAENRLGMARRAIRDYVRRRLA